MKKSLLLCQRFGDCFRFSFIYLFTFLNSMDCIMLHCIWNWWINLQEWMHYKKYWYWFMICWKVKMEISVFFFFVETKFLWCFFFFFFADHEERIELFHQASTKEEGFPFQPFLKWVFCFLFFCLLIKSNRAIRVSNEFIGIQASKVLTLLIW
jgi:hypothetical protein